MPPVKYCSISKAEMLRKFSEENWIARLDGYSCQTVTYSRKSTRVWKDGNIVVGIVTWHVNPTGVEMVVRLLRESFPDGDVIWDINHTTKGTQISLPLSSSRDELS
jgi:hypothetical protein